MLVVLRVATGEKKWRGTADWVRPVMDGLDKRGDGCTGERPVAYGPCTPDRRALRNTATRIATGAIQDEVTTFMSQKSDDALGLNSGHCCFFMLGIGRCERNQPIEQLADRPGAPTSYRAYPQLPYPTLASPKLLWPHGTLASGLPY